jgi:hypothetical protein
MIGVVVDVHFRLLTARKKAHGVLNTGIVWPILLRNKIEELLKGTWSYKG